MIAFIKGCVVEKAIQGVIIEAYDIGYFIFITQQTQQELSIDQPVKLLIYEHLREDDHNLYGFLDQASKQLFEFLITVSGVGPKMALSIMNVGTSQDLTQAIINSDKKYLTSASGVGSRLAERIILELKDKLKPLGSSQKTLPKEDEEVLRALQSLGL